MPQPGDIVEVKDKDRIVAAVALSFSAKYVHVLNPEGRDFKTSSEKVYLISPGLDVSQGKDSLSAGLREIDRKRESLKSEIQLKLLWEIAHDKDEAKTPLDLAKLYFGRECGEDETAAMIRALYADFGYFRPRGNGFFPVDEKTVRAMELGRKQQEARKAWEESFVSWLARGGTTPLPAGSEKAMAVLKDYLVCGDSPSKPHPAKELLRKAKITDPDQVYGMLMNVGILKKDENLLLEKYHVPREFSAALHEEAEKTLRFFAVSGERLDLTSLDTFSIDDIATTDIDDALTIEFLPEGCRVGIHIADVSEFIPKNSPLDKEAHTRSTSIYLPDEKINMLPESITQAASLKQGEVRPALSILADFHSNGQMTSWALKETLIQVKERLTYDEVDEKIRDTSQFSEQKLGSVPNFFKLYEMADQWQEKRKEGGAVIVQFPRVELAVHKETGEITFAKAKDKTKSQVLVSEWMVLANHLAANFCSQSGIPTIYRTQDPPGKVLPLSPGDWVSLLRQRRFLRKGEASVQPSPHHGLGLPVYVQMTSPIRRYGDLVVHRQLKAAMRKEALPYTEADLEAILAYSERWVEISDIVEREWKKYWLLRYLESKIGERFEAVVIETNFSDYFLYIPELSLEVNCAKTMKPLAEGDPVEVILEEVKPRRGIIKVIAL